MALLEITDLKVYFRILKGRVRAVDGVSFILDRGETMGLVGESGCGKTTTAFSIMRLLPSNGSVVGGDIVFNNQVVAWGSLANELSEALGDMPEDDERWAEQLDMIISRKLERIEKLGEILPAALKADDEKVAEAISAILKGEGGPGPFKEAVRKYLSKELNSYRGMRRRLKRERMLEGRIRSVRWAEVSMIFQSAMNAFNPVHRVGDQIMEAILTHHEVFENPYCPECKKSYSDTTGLSKDPTGRFECPVHKKSMDRKHLTKAEAREITLKLFALVGLDSSRIDGYPHEFSGGMKQRSMIAMALACNPHLIIADEPTTALDVIMQDRILAEISRLQKKLNIAMMIITHDISVVAEVSEKIGIMYAGKLIEHGNIKSIFKTPSHPYTIGLMNAFPSILGEKKKLKSIPGSPPDLANPPKGCRFHPRCSLATEKCREVEPETFEVDPGHYSACIFAREIFAGQKEV